MSPARRALLLSALAGAACKPAPGSAPVAAPTPAPQTRRAPPPAGSGGPVEQLHIQGQAHELDDLLAGVDRALASWVEDAPTWRPQISALLLSTGFGPGMLDAIDLQGRFGLEVAYPHPDQVHTGPRDVAVSASVPTRDARALLDGLPGAYRPQPLGEGRWELTSGELRYLLEATPDALRLGLDEAQLQRASALVAEPPTGARLQGRVWNIPRDDIDPGAVLGERRPSSGTRVTEVVQQLEAVEGELDFGRERDLHLRLRAQAPFDRFPLEIYGDPATGPGELAPRLPGGAAMRAVLSWADAGPARRAVEGFAAGLDLPPPFDGVVDALSQGAVTVLDALAHEVAVAVYLDGKQRAGVLLAARVEDPSAARAGLRTIFEAAQRTIESHIALVGDDPEFEYRVSFKPEAVTMGKARVDRFVVTVPKFLQRDTRGAAALLGARKPQVEIFAHVEGELAVVAIGAGARDLMSGVIRGPAKGVGNLESDGGLALAREVSGGCAICATVNLRGLARLAATVLRDLELRTDGDALVAQANALPFDAALSVGLTVREAHASLGLGAPQGLLFAPPRDARAYRELYERFGDAPPRTPVKPSTEPMRPGSR